MTRCSDPDAPVSETAAPEIEVTPVWEAFICDSSGFVLSGREDTEEMLALFPDEQEIDFQLGDFFPEEIVIVKGSARPRPQYEGSDILRQPSSHFTEDKIFEYNLEQTETSEELREVWERAKAMAMGLNVLEAQRALGG